MVNKPEFNSLLLKPIEGKKKRKEGAEEVFQSDSVP
jgi:hypothetical protein